MAQDGVFKDDLDVGGITLLYEEFLDYADEGDGFTNDDVVIPSQRLHTDSPIVYGEGPVDFTTCTDVARVYPPYHVWDVEGYYRALGVSHLATRRDLRRRFLEIDGHSSERLTWIVKTLLDQAQRHEYDMLPLGARWIEDPWVQDDIKKKAAVEAQKRRMMGWESSAEAVLNEWGFKQVEDEFGPEGLNTNNNKEALREQQLAEQDGVINDAWCYSYFMWRTTNTTAPMQQWQEMLLAAASRSKYVGKMAIGLLGKAENAFAIENIHGHTVVFISDGHEPSNSIADEAITQLAVKATQ